MTIKYALTRSEIVRFFFYGLVRSRKFLARILRFPIFLGVAVLATDLAVSRKLTVRDGVESFAWMIAVFLVMVLLVFIRAKTDERTLIVSQEGISTQIGSHGLQLPWNNLVESADMGRYVLLVLSNGNSFFIPSRAFSGPVERAEFLREIGRWREAK